MRSLAYVLPLLFLLAGCLDDAPVGTRKYVRDPFLKSLEKFDLKNKSLTLHAAPGTFGAAVLLEAKPHYWETYAYGSAKTSNAQLLFVPHGLAKPDLRAFYLYLVMDGKATLLAHNVGLGDLQSYHRVTTDCAPRNASFLVIGVTDNPRANFSFTLGFATSSYNPRLRATTTAKYAAVDNVTAANLSLYLEQQGQALFSRGVKVEDSRPGVPVVGKPSGVVRVLTEHALSSPGLNVAAFLSAGTHVTDLKLDAQRDGQAYSVGQPGAPYVEGSGWLSGSAAGSAKANLEARVGTAAGLRMALYSATAELDLERMGVSVEPTSWRSVDATATAYGRYAAAPAC